MQWLYILLCAFYGNYYVYLCAFYSDERIFICCKCINSHDAFLQLKTEMNMNEYEYNFGDVCKNGYTRLF